MYRVFAVCAAFAAASCLGIYDEQVVEGAFEAARGPRALGVRGLLQCGYYDFECYLDNAESIVERRKVALLAEADEDAAANGMARGSEESPTNLTGTIQKLLQELSGIIRQGFDNIFRDAKDNAVDAKDDLRDDDDEDRSGLNGEARGKKKKKLKALIKFLIVGAVIKAKLTLLLQLLSAGLQVKFFLIALAGLLLNVARLWIDLKKGHHPQKVIYYEHAQHQHHYDHVEDEHGGGGGFWGRAYELPDKDAAQDLAYSKQRPIPWAV